VQNLAQDAVDGGRRLGPLLVAEVWEPVLQPVQLGVRELPDLRVHRGDDGCRDRLVLPGGVRRGLGGDDGADLGDLARHRSAGQVPAEGGDVDQRHAGQPPRGGVHVGWHAQVQDEQRPAAGRCPGGPHVLGEDHGGGGAGGGDQDVGVGERGGHVAGPQLPASTSATARATGPAGPGAAA
jgi:hypothetical protein